VHMSCHRWLRYWFLIFSMIGATTLGVLCCLLHNPWMDLTLLERYTPDMATVVLDDEGNELCRFQLDRREPITLDLLPPHVINAFIAAEDWHFFTHSGLSYKGIARSLLVNITKGRCVQGASTITQQLVKLLFFDARKTFSRKIKEQAAALLLEHHCTKEQILQAYLNQVFFGCGIYGVQAASQRFWGCDAAQLNVEQAALLAGIVRSPGRYCPLLYPLSAQRIRNVVLKSMYTLGYIDKETYQTALPKPINVIPHVTSDCAPYCKEMLRLFLEKQLGKRALYTQGFVVQTTINRHMQEAANQAFADQYAHLCTKMGPEIDGALITIEVNTGHLKALVGGANFERSKFNRAMQARRQIGSIIKPLLYAAALERGCSFTDTAIDEPIELVTQSAVWQPHNYDEKFNGEITLAYALSHSNNIVSIKTLLHIGAEHLVRLIKECGFTGTVHSYPSLALGCIDATLYEAVGMFNIFANDGVFVPVHSVRWIKNKWGQKVFKQESASHRVLSSQIAGRVARVLELGLARMKTHFAQQWIASQAISKTGTTNDWRTCWFVGSTPQYTTAVYIGFDDNRPMGTNAYPIHTAFPVWLSFNRAVPSSIKQFSYDTSLQEIIINERTGTQVADRHAEGAITIFA